ncbi:unnamed protein product [Rotaria sp. Silwood2]|nr:unnamed protein product [Rotaria sp. Silwood2]CAF4459594.1 unnamed protein product [Rotaria sp. Silwood2]
MIGGWTTNPTNYIGLVCKLRGFFVFTTRTIGSWFVVLATVDRWLLSSIDAHRRQRSTLINAKRWTIIIVLLSSLLYAQQLYCYEANLIDTPLRCYGKTVACRYLTDLSFAVMTIILPLFFMILFGLLIISNVRQSQSRIQALQLQNTNSTRTKSFGLTAGTADTKKKYRKHSHLQMATMNFHSTAHSIYLLVQ